MKPEDKRIADAINKIDLRKVADCVDFIIKELKSIDDIVIRDNLSVALLQQMAFLLGENVPHTSGMLDIAKLMMFDRTHIEKRGTYEYFNEAARRIYR